VVHLERLEAPRFPADAAMLSRVVATAFNQRRKMLRASLRGLDPDIEARLRAVGIAAHRAGRGNRPLRPGETVLHYVFMVLGLWLVWSARTGLTLGGAGRSIIAWALIGFGTWHIIDAVVAHWVLQLHRIRMDVDNPLLWDLIWFVPFGLVTLAIGVWILRREPNDGEGPRGRPAAAILSLMAVVAAPLAALPPRDLLDDGMTVAVFRPGLSFADIVAATDAVGGSLVWSDASQGVWLIALGDGARPATLYRHGALMVSTGPVAIGCLSWTEL
jgi:hypothetical protein